MAIWGLFSKEKRGGGQSLKLPPKKELNNNWNKFGLFKEDPVRKRRRLKLDNIFRSSVCLKIVGQKKEDDLMFNELSFNFDLTHSLKLRYFYNCIPIQTDPCQDKIKFKSYMLWFCFCFFNTYKKQLHMKARLRKDKMCFSSSSKSCKKSLGSVLAGAWLPPPPTKSCK